ncbi:MAG: TetR/AcrR family transcriptional regulator [Lachnospiraceae bacterium]|nr:TetR/AcrR family transcriptional regulator [Lachnospiraceae bacterium]
MSEKSAQKKQLIVKTARRIFIEKGYKNVTMKDIVEACNISRGGLYLYFSSVEEIFLEVLRVEESETDDVFSSELTEEATATDVLMIFFKEQKKEILRRNDDFSVAVYEYYFEKGLTKQDNPMRTKFDDGVNALISLLEAGIDSGEFYDVDVRAAAANIMFVLEGLRICARTMGVTEGMVDDELLTLVSGIVAEV